VDFLRAASTRSSFSVLKASALAEKLRAKAPRSKSESDSAASDLLGASTYRTPNPISESWLGSRMQSDILSAMKRVSVWANIEFGYRLAADRPHLESNPAEQAALTMIRHFVSAV